MNPNSVELSNLSKSFEYIKFSNQIDSIDNIEKLSQRVKDPGLSAALARFAARRRARA